MGHSDGAKLPERQTGAMTLKIAPDQGFAVPTGFEPAFPA